MIPPNVLIWTRGKEQHSTRFSFLLLPQGKAFPDTRLLTTMMNEFVVCIHRMNVLLERSTGKMVIVQL